MENEIKDGVTSKNIKSPFKPTCTTPKEHDRSILGTLVNIVVYIMPLEPVTAYTVYAPRRLFDCCIYEQLSLSLSVLRRAMIASV